MKKSWWALVIVSVMVLTISAVAPNALAQQGTPSSKATADINTAVGCTFAIQSTLGDTLPATQCHDIFSGAAVAVTPDNFATIMTGTIKVSNSQSLFVSPSLVTGLYTETRTKTSTGSSSKATAEGGVFLRAIVTNQATGVTQVGYPVRVCTNDILGCQLVGGTDYGVTLDTRVQTLSQEISACVVNVVVGGVGVSGTCSFDSTIDLILKTTSAHTFNFIFPNVGVGVYAVQIQAAVNAKATVDVGSGTAIGGAAYGLGSLTVESVRLVHGFEFDF